jgi:hypothetical protein
MRACPDEKWEKKKKKIIALKTPVESHGGMRIESHIFLSSSTAWHAGHEASGA